MEFFKCTFAKTGNHLPKVSTGNARDLEQSSLSSLSKTIEGQGQPFLKYTCRDEHFGI